jgi:hypothetical protein
LFIGPGSGDIGSGTEDGVLVVFENAVVSDVSGKDGALVLEQGLDPDATMLEVFSADGILAAEDGSLNAARPGVVDGDFAGSDDVLPAWPGMARILSVKCALRAEPECRFD